MKFSSIHFKNVTSGIKYIWHNRINAQQRNSPHKTNLAFDYFT